MRISELMTTDVITVGSETPLKEAARRMLEAGVSGLPVTDDDGVLVGIITEADFVKTEASRDVAKRAGLLRWFVHDEGFPTHERTVEDVMSTPVHTVTPDADHPVAARALLENRIKRLPVVENDRLVGLVSRTDLMRTFIRPDQAIIDDILGDIMRRILWIEPERVSVGCIDGNVKLAGRVQTRSDAELLASLTRRLDGVGSVDDDLTWEVDNTKLETASPVTSPFIARGR